MPSQPPVPVLEMNEDQYQAWSQARLAVPFPEPGQNTVHIANPSALTDNERAGILNLVSTHNFVIYQVNDDYPVEATTISRMCRQLSLARAIPNPGADDNCVTEITCNSNLSTPGTGKNYIPYTNKALNWHTDGYYNHEGLKVRSFVLHCRHAAADGGLTTLLDSEIAYILVREQNPAWAAALCQPGLFTIPENIVDGLVLRDAYSGTVFSTDPETGRLYTRFSQRKRNMQWVEDKKVRQALDAFNQILGGDNPWKMTFQMQPGQGILCNNILHNRSAYEDSDPDSPRLLYRIRFADAIPFDDAIQSV